jgi:A/G-specific adenine glycosylase
MPYPIASIVAEESPQPITSMLEKNLATMRRRVLRWYDGNRRDLPWRRTSDPYAIWIAESMLQQTQVKTVLPYFERFMKTLPTLEALDRAPLRKILMLWSGLGYYRRAENLKRAAREIARNHDGKIPASYNSLRSLPGIGDYTAGALMSIAFRQPFPAVDGNAQRVLKRFFGAKTQTELQILARRAVSCSRPGDFNQALMELGARICVSQRPDCLRCPLAPGCDGRTRVSAEAALVRRKTLGSRARKLEPRSSRGARRPSHEGQPRTTRVRKVDWPLALIRSEGKVLLRRRSGGGLLPGLWELPGGETEAKDSLGTALKRHIHALSGIKAEGCIGAFQHTITNRRISSSVFLFSVHPNLRLPSRDWRWFTPAALARQPTSAMTRKAINALQDHEKSLL